MLELHLSAIDASWAVPNTAPLLSWQVRQVRLVLISASTRNRSYPRCILQDSGYDSSAIHDILYMHLRTATRRRHASVSHVLSSCGARSSLGCRTKHGQRVCDNATASASGTIRWTARTVMRAQGKGVGNGEMTASWLSVNPEMTLGFATPSDLAATPRPHTISTQCHHPPGQPSSWSEKLQYGSSGSRCYHSTRSLPHVAAKRACVRRFGGRIYRTARITFKVSYLTCSPKLHNHFQPDIRRNFTAIVHPSARSNTR